MDWAETLLCNAIPMPHCTQEDWDKAVQGWRNEKHKKPVSQSPQPASLPDNLTIDAWATNWFYKQDIAGRLQGAIWLRSIAQPIINRLEARVKELEEINRKAAQDWAENDSALKVLITPEVPDEKEREHDGYAFIDGVTAVTLGVTRLREQLSAKQREVEELKEASDEKIADLEDRLRGAKKTLSSWLTKAISERDVLKKENALLNKAVRETEGSWKAAVSALEKENAELREEKAISDQLLRNATSDLKEHIETIKDRDRLRAEVESYQRCVQDRGNLIREYHKRHGEMIDEENKLRAELADLRESNNKLREATRQFFCEIDGEDLFGGFMQVLNRLREALSNDSGGVESRHAQLSVSGRPSGCPQQPVGESESSNAGQAKTDHSEGTKSESSASPAVTLSTSTRKEGDDNEGGTKAPLVTEPAQNVQPVSAGTISPGDGYRLLGPDDVRQEGDQIWRDGTWIDITQMMGTKSWTAKMVYRRPLALDDPDGVGKGYGKIDTQKAVRTLGDEFLTSSGTWSPIIGDHGIEYGKSTATYYTTYRRPL